MMAFFGCFEYISSFYFETAMALELVMLWPLALVWSAFVPGATTHVYSTGETVVLLNSKLGPLSDRKVGIHPYSAPLCMPNLENDNDWAEQYKIFFTERSLSAKRIARAGGFPSPSVYKIAFNETVRKRQACMVVLSPKEKQQLQNMITEEYYYEFFVGQQYVRALVGTMKERLFSMGDPFVYTHLTLAFVTKQNTIRKIIAKPSVEQCLNCEGSNIAFTYSVEWVPETSFLPKESTEFSFKSNYSALTLTLQYLLNLSLTTMLAIAAGIFLFSRNAWAFLVYCKRQIMLQFQKSVEGVANDEYDVIVHSDWFDALVGTQYPEKEKKTNSSDGQTPKKAEIENTMNSAPEIEQKVNLAPEIEPKVKPTPEVEQKVKPTPNPEEKRGWQVTFPAIQKLSLSSEKDQDLKGTALAMARRVQLMQGLEQYEADSNSLKTIFVAVLGLYNKGKTYVLNRIGGTNLAEGVSSHTEGISMKTPRKKPFSRFTLVDIAGFDAPIEVSSKNSERTISNRQDIDLFIEEVVLRLSSVFIVVVGDITLKDQRYLEKLTCSLHSFQASFSNDSRSGEVNTQSRSKLHDLIVVHNFALEKDLSHCKKAFKTQVELNYTDAMWNEEELGSYYMVKEVAREKAGMRHVFVGRSSDPSSAPTEMDRHNSMVFKIIRRWIDSGISNDTAVEPLNEIVNCCNVVFKRFASEPPPPLVLSHVPSTTEHKNERMLIGFDQNKYVKIKSLQGGQVSPDEKKETTLYLKRDFALDGSNALLDSPPYDILVATDAVFIFLDPAAMKVSLKYNPNTKKCQVKGEIRRPAIYNDQYNYLVYQQRFTGPFDFSVDLGRVLKDTTFSLVSLNKDENKRETVVKLVIQKEMVVEESSQD